MRTLKILTIFLLLAACKPDQKDDHQKSTGDTINSNYPKEITIETGGSARSFRSFLVFLGSDGHEYQVHQETRVPNQWVHYGGCTLCTSRLDTILKYAKNTGNR
jgi:hydroxymethylpyrimidine/phosphomethylpyrimidine kinase